MFILTLPNLETLSLGRYDLVGSIVVVIAEMLARDAREPAAAIVARRKFEQGDGDGLRVFGGHLVTCIFHKFGFSERTSSL